MLEARVMIAVPNLGKIDTRLMMRLIRWASIKGVWSNIEIVAPIGHIPHDSARNYCLDLFLQSDCTHIFFIDSDVVPPLDALEKLLLAEKPVITGIYPSTWYDNEKKEMSRRNNVFSELKENGELVEAKGKGVVCVHSAGAGCLLIQRDVIEQDIDSPVFKFEYNSVGMMIVGEDVYFCNKMREAGVYLYAHFDVQCNHVKETVL